MQRQAGHTCNVYLNDTQMYLHQLGYTSLLISTCADKSSLALPATKAARQVVGSLLFTFKPAPMMT